MSTSLPQSSLHVFGNAYPACSCCLLLQSGHLLVPAGLLTACGSNNQPHKHPMWTKHCSGVTQEAWRSTHLDFCLEATWPCLPARLEHVSKVFKWIPEKNHTTWNINASPTKGLLNCQSMVPRGFSGLCRWQGLWEGSWWSIHMASRPGKSVPCAGFKNPRVPRSWPYHFTTLPSSLIDSKDTRGPEKGSNLLDITQKLNTHYLGVLSILSGKVKSRLLFAFIPPVLE